MLVIKMIVITAGTGDSPPNTQRLFTRYLRVAVSLEVGCCFEILKDILYLIISVHHMFCFISLGFLCTDWWGFFSSTCSWIYFAVTKTALNFTPKNYKWMYLCCDPLPLLLPRMYVIVPSDIISSLLLLYWLILCAKLYHLSVPVFWLSMSLA